MRLAEERLFASLAPTLAPQAMTECYSCLVKRLELRYEGKAKRVYATEDPLRLIVEYKDDATAFNAQKRGVIQDKGIINNAVSASLFTHLAATGIPTHFVERLSAREQLVEALAIIPIEVVVRNRAAGSFATRYGVREGATLNPTVIEWCYKSDALGDPPMNDDTALALGLAKSADLDAMRALATAVNKALRPHLAKRKLELVDFKLEFGKRPSGEVVLADEISPDTCRLWDVESGEKLDKDRFRRDLGGVGEAYAEVYRRLVDEPTREAEHV